jgi:hypothetical protein
MNDQTPDPASLPWRVQRLEEDMADIKTALEKLGDKIDALSVVVHRMDGKLSQLPTTWQMITAMIGSPLVVIGAAWAISKLLH